MAIEQPRATEQTPRTPRGTLNVARWNEILEAAGEVFHEKGYQAARIEDIAARVGILKGSLYYYIESKEDLLFALSDQAHSSGVESIAEPSSLAGADAATRLGAFIARWCVVLDANPPYATVAERDVGRLSGERYEQVMAKRNQLHRFVRSIIEQGIAEGSFDPATDPGVADQRVVRVDERDSSLVPPGRPQDHEGHRRLVPHVRPPRPRCAGRTVGVVGATPGALRVPTRDGLTPSPRRPDIPLGANTVPAALAAAVARRPDAEALVGRSARFTYRELDQEVRRAASVLAAQGVGPGDRVAGSMANHTELVILFLATMHLGAIWVGVNRGLAAPEQQYLLADAGASVFVGDRTATATVAALRDYLPALRTLLDAEPGDPASTWATQLRAADPDPAPAADVDPFAPAAIAYTSGTTGRPKGVVHSQHNLLLVAAVAMTARTHDERIGVLLPLTILNLMILGPVTALDLGACVVCIDRIDPVGLASWIRDERVSTFSAVPAIIHDLLTHPDVDPADLASARAARVWWRLDSRRVPPALPGALRHAPHDGLRAHRGTDCRHRRRIRRCPPVPGGSGHALPHVDVTVRDDDGNVVAPGRGRRSVRRPGRAKGCSPVCTRRCSATGDGPTPTAAAVRDDVLYTGDLGYLTPDGDLLITDRKGDLILRGGANVYPAEVERVLHDDPRVARLHGARAPRRAPR